MVKLTKNKGFLFILIVYLGYVLILLILAIPYIPEMLNPNTNASGLYINPVLIFGVAAAVPIALVYIIREFKHIAAPFLALNRRILVYTTFFLMLQFGINVMLAICLVLVKQDLLNITTYNDDDILIVWVISFSFCVFAGVLNIYIGWKWSKAGLENPSGLHWFVGYLLYFLGISVSVISIQILNPTVKNILLWPLAGIGIFGALNLFLVSFMLFVGALEIIGASMFSSESDAFVGLVFMMGTIFMLVISVLPFLYALTFYLGVKLANRRT